MIKNFNSLVVGDILDRDVDSYPLIVLGNTPFDDDSTLYELTLAPIDITDDCMDWIAANHTDWHLTLQELKHYHVVGHTDPNAIANLKEFTIKY